MAEQYGLPLLGQLPLDLRIREDLDNGCPTVVSAPASELTLRYRDVARAVSARLSTTPRSLAISLPQINIRNS
jgi:ATP-binding protein involved in chromosome partitioning